MNTTYNRLLCFTMACVCMRATIICARMAEKKSSMFAVWKPFYFWELRPQMIERNENAPSVCIKLSRLSRYVGDHMPFQFWFGSERFIFLSNIYTNANMNAFDKKNCFFFLLKQTVTKNRRYQHYLHPNTCPKIKKLFTFCLPVLLTF